MNIYFDDVLIDNDYYTYLDNNHKLFEDNTNFKLGATACNSFRLSIDKSVISSHPTEVKIDDGATIFYLIVDSVEEDNYTYTYTLVDKLMKFNFYYDASPLIEEKQALSEDCYLSDIWHDMCDKVGIEYDDTYVFQNDMIVTWYDNRRQARQYLSYISELQYGFARINENGKQTFKKHNSSSIKTIDIDECSDFILGEQKVISRVVYDDGITKWEFGDTTGATVYLNTENVYIINENIVENIYNDLVGFTFYNLTVPQCPIDSLVRAGDVITFTDEINSYPTIAQYSTVFNGSWTGGYKLSVNTELQQETQIIGVDMQVKNIQTTVDRLNNELTIVVEEINENTSNISEIQVDTETITERILSAETSINSLNETITTINEVIQEQTSTAITTWFNQSGIQGILDDVQENLDSNNDTLTNIQSYIKESIETDEESPYYGLPFIELGKTGNETKLIIRNNRISFMTGSTESAYINQNQLYITDSTILNKLQVGDWEQKPDELGNLNMRFVGDET